MGFHGGTYLVKIEMEIIFSLCGIHCADDAPNIEKPCALASTRVREKG